MINNWYGTSGAISAANRAERIWNLILRDPTSLVVDRDGVDLPAQTVKLTRDNDAKWVGGDSAVGKSASREVQIFGITGHSCEDDTDLETGDRFAVGKIRYEIRDVFDVPGGIQARAQQMEG